MERDDFVNENFKRGFPELRKNITKKKVSAQVMIESSIAISAPDINKPKFIPECTCIWLM